MKDVAVRAGVSVSTVSLVLSGRGEGRISPAVSDRVRLAASELGYVPNLVAKGLRTRQTHTIGLLSDSVASTPFAGTMLAAAQRTAWDSGYLLLLIDTAGTPELEVPAAQALLQRNIEGLIYASMYHRVVKLPPALADLPVVVLDGRPDPADDADSIIPDEKGGAELAVNALITAGHRHIAFCNNAEPIPASSLRLAGYHTALTNAGLPIHPSLTVNADEGSVATGYAAAGQLLDRADRPTALFCFNDRIALGVYRAASERNLRIPQDLSVVGFDNQEFIVDAFDPGLTTVALPHAEMGTWAATQIIQRIHGESEATPTRAVLAECQLITRASITPPTHP